MSKRSIKPHDESNVLRDHPLGRDYALQSVFAMFAPGYRDQQGVLAVPLRVVDGEPPELHLLSPSEAALDRVKQILATPGAKIEGFAIDPPPEHDVQKWGRALAGSGMPALPPSEQPPAEDAGCAASVQPTDDAPFTLVVREGRRVVADLGPFERVTEAIDARDSFDAEPRQTATIYDGRRVAEYRGGRAVFRFGRTRWSRAA